jgi:hypothetical protein
MKQYVPLRLDKSTLCLALAVAQNQVTLHSYCQLPVYPLIAQLRNQAVPECIVRASETTHLPLSLCTCGLPGNIQRLFSGFIAMLRAYGNCGYLLAERESSMPTKQSMNFSAGACLINSPSLVLMTTIFSPIKISMESFFIFINVLAY